MATTTPTSFLKITFILFITIPLLLQPLHSHQTLFADEDDVEEYILDNPLTVPSNLRTHSRFLTTSKIVKIKKGARCNYSYNICNGVPANNGTSLLNCCKNHCRNILRDENNCGSCGHKCKFGQRCCGRVCMDVTSNDNHCGKCERKCATGVKCELGSCGYA
ncbi:hypothetical protein ACFE04_022503 [Oxalis oulophora]